MRSTENRLQQRKHGLLATAIALILLVVVAAMLLCGAGEAGAQASIPEAARVEVPPEAKGTPEAVRLLRYGWQRADADTLAQQLLVEAEAEYGPESLEAADALDLLVWSFKWGLYEPLGHPKFLERARPLATRALAIKEAQLEPDDPRLAPSLDNMAGVLWTEGDTTQAETLARQSLAIREKAYGPEHPDVALSLRIIGHMRFKFDVEEAQRLYRQALQIQEQALAWDDLRLLETLDWLQGSIMEISGWESKEAVGLERRGMQITESRFGPHQVRTLAHMEGCAQRSMWIDPKESEDLYWRGMAMSEEALGPARALTIRFYGGWADILTLNYADPDSAARFLGEKVELVGEEWGLLFNYGSMLGIAGQEEEAVLVLDRAIRRLEQMGVPQSPYRHLVSWVLNGRAVNLESLGLYSEAERDLDRADSLLQSLPVIEDDAARTQANMHAVQAALKMRTGEFDDAKALYERAINEATEAGIWALVIATIHSGYGHVLASIGDLEPALAQVQQAQSIYEEIAGPNSPRGLENLYVLADIKLDLGRTTEARLAFEHCLEAREALLGADHPAVARTLIGIARLEREEGQLDAARQNLERAIGLQERVYGSVHPDLALSKARLADVALAQGDLETALSASLQAEEAGREHFRLTAQAFSERRALTYAGSRSSGLDLALAATQEKPGAPAISATWDAVIRSRGLVLDELAARRRALGVSGDATADSLLVELRMASNRIANLVVRGTGGERGQDSDKGSAPALGTEKLRQFYKEARENKERLEEELAQHSLAFREDLARAALGYQDVVSAVPEGAALVAYVRHAVPGPRAGNPSDASWRYSAFVQLQHDPEPAFIPLGDAAEIDTLVASWQKAIGSDTKVASAPPIQDYRIAGNALREEIWDPIAARLNEADRVFIVPDGALHLISFAALPTSESSFLVEAGPLVHYLSTERDLLTSESAGATKGLLAIGGPAFDDRSLFAVLAEPTEQATPTDNLLLAVNVTRGARRSACGSFGTLHFEPLPGSLEEVEQVSDTWVLRSGYESGAHVSLTGADATELAFKSNAPGSEFVHVATHGFFLGGECRSVTDRRGMGGIVLASAGTVSPIPVAGDNPLLMCGLALAGANHRAAAAPTEEDGILTAEEIATLDLSGVEWAVLSACETGVGEIRAGEGVLGLQRAFRIAGANTLIMSLWSVEDEATRNWMKYLYEARLVDGLDTAESVRQASLRTLSERRANGLSTSPFYWGAFVAAGDWR